MNILFIAPYLPSRIRVRPYAFICELAKRHNVDVIALDEASEKNVQGVKDLLDVARSVVVIPHTSKKGLFQSLCALPTPTPMCAAYCRSGSMKRAIAEALKASKYDIIHIEHMRAAHFAPVGSGYLVLFDAVDCLTSLFKQMAASKRNPVGKMVMLEEAWKLKSYEPRIARQFDRVIVTSQSEQAELTSLAPSLDVGVVPNGVDVDYFAPSGKPKQSARIVFSGKMSYAPNAQAALWFANNIFPAIQRQHPDAEFVIVGSNPPDEVKRLSSQANIQVTGYVDDIRPYLHAASIAVTPMQMGAGIQNKLLEAMAAGLPVVASSLATRALEPGCPGVICADSIEEVTRAVLTLLDNLQLAADMGQAGRIEVSEKFSWQSSVDKLEAIYQTILDQHSR